MNEVIAASTTAVSSPPLEARTVAEAFQRVVAQWPDRVAIRTLGDERSLTWAELNSEVRDLAGGLAAYGIGHGDTVALLLPNTPECHMIDYAALHLGAVPFAIFFSSSVEQITEQLSKSDARTIVTEVAALARVQAAVDLTSRAITVVTVEDTSDEGVVSLSTLRRSGLPDFDFESSWRAVRPDDILTIIFTSGTTGAPKAAQWTHHTAMEAQRAMDAGIPVTRESVVSFLPLAHAGGRLTCHYMALSYGATITACPNMADAGSHIADAHPDALLSVPRVFEKLQVAIEGIIDTLEDADRRTALRAIEFGRRLAREGDAGKRCEFDASSTAPLADQHREDLAVMRPILRRLGLDRLRSAIVGGAPAAPELIYFYRAIGIPLMEAYGSSEAALPIFNRVDKYKSGTAGVALPGVTLATGPDGELLVKSSFNFVGYRKQDDESAAALDARGFLHTGDIADIDDDGFVTIIDRKKELMISSAGKNMSPANIEAAVRGEHSLIGHVVAVGDGRNYVTALVTFDLEAAARASRSLGLTAGDLQALAAHPDVRQEIDDAVRRGNARLSRPEQIKKHRILPVAWSPDSDELTPTGKIKRRNIAAKYAAIIDDLYRS